MKREVTMQLILHSYRVLSPAVKVFIETFTWQGVHAMNLFTNLLSQATTVEENQNKNEPPKPELPVEAKESSEAAMATSIAASPDALKGAPDLEKQPQTNSMEVHPPHHGHHSLKKKWSDLLLEFFMLFLAVFLGFIAENIREHLVEKSREKEYVQSMIADMKSDIKQLDSLNDRRRVKEQMIDSLLLILDLPKPGLYGNQLYYYSRWMPRVLRIITNDGTMQQLKSGNLRLIRNNNAVDAMLEYDRWVRFGNYAVEEREESLIQQFYPSLKKVFDPRIFEKMVDGMKISWPAGNPQLLRNDKESLDELYSHLHFLKNVNSYAMEFNDKRRKLAEHVVEVLHKEYHLE